MIFIYEKLNSMKNPLIISLFILLFSQMAFAQVDNNSNLKNQFIIKVIPIPFFDHYSPRLRMGLEYATNKRYGFNVDIGYGDNNLNHWLLKNHNWEQGYLFYEIRPQVKYRFTNNKYFNFYGGLELFYLHMSNDYESSYFNTRNSDKVTTYDFARYNKAKLGSHLIVGIDLLAVERLKFNFFLGLGFARRSVYYTELVNPKVSYDGPIPDGWLFSSSDEGESYVFHMTLGVKIGYVLFQH